MLTFARRLVAVAAVITGFAVLLPACTDPGRPAASSQQGAF